MWPPRSLVPNADSFMNSPHAFCAVAHFYLATNWLSACQEPEGLKKEVRIQLNQYAFSSSLMMVLIGMFIGLWDLGSLILIFHLNPR